MTRSLKTAFGLSVLVALVVGVMGAMSASAKVSGHFVSGATKTEFKATEATGTAHATTLSAYGSTVSCHNVKYQVHHTSAATFTSLTVTPTYENCTVGGGPDTATVRMNGCHYEFKSKSSTAAGHATVHLLCPVGKKAEVETPNGTEKFGAQTPTSGGVTYTNVAGGTVTANVTVEGIHAECHGLCQFLGTNTTTATLKGAVKVEGLNTEGGAKVHLTAT